MSKNNKKRYLLCAGGSGGHIFPAIALSEEIQNNGEKYYFSSDVRGLKYFDTKEHKVFKTYTSKFGGNLVDKFIAANLLGIDIIRFIFIILFYRINIICGFGSFPTLAPLIAAKICFKKVHMHEQNSLMGKVNRLGSKFCRSVGLTFPNTKYCTNKNSVFIGNLIRQDILKIYNKPLLNLNEHSNINILITGGSQGSKIFSQLPEAIKLLPEELKRRINITQQTRKEDIVKTVEAYNSLKVQNTVSDFFTNMNDLLLKTDLMICRAGSSTTSEASLAGIPCIFVPLAIAMDDHQNVNAEYYTKNNAAWILQEDEFTAKNAAKLIQNLLYNVDKLNLASANIKKLGITDAAAKLYTLINK